MPLLGGMWVGIYTDPLLPLLKISFTPIKGSMALMPLSYASDSIVQPGFVNGGQSEEAKRPSGGSPPTIGRVFENLCMKTAFSCTLNAIIRGYRLYNLLSSNQGGGGGHGPLCPLAMPMTVVQPGFVNGRPKRGSKSTERGGGCGRGIPLPSSVASCLVLGGGGEAPKIYR